MAGRDVTRVVNRCNDAKSSKKLDLTECKLNSVPESVFFLLRETQIFTLSLAKNMLMRVPAKIANQFTNITHLSICGNKVKDLPENIVNLHYLASLDISENLFEEFPSAVYEMRNLKTVNARHNSITEVNTERMARLKSLDMSENPLTSDTYHRLRQCTAVDVKLSSLSSSGFEDVD